MIVAKSTPSLEGQVLIAYEKRYYKYSERVESRFSYHGSDGESKCDLEKMREAKRPSQRVLVRFRRKGPKHRALQQRKGIVKGARGAASERGRKQARARWTRQRSRARVGVNRKRDLERNQTPLIYVSRSALEAENSTK